MLIVKQTLNSLVLFEPLARPDPDLAAPGVHAEGLEARPGRVPQAVADLRVAAHVGVHGAHAAHDEGAHRRLPRHVEDVRVLCKGERE